MIRNRALPFLGECYADEARPFSSQDVCNWLPAPAEKPGTLTPEMAQTPPGLSPFVQVSGANATKPVRGTYNCEGKLFAVIGNQLYRITNKGIAVPLGTIPGVTRALFAHNQITNGNQLVTVNGSAGYVYDTPTDVFERITDPGYPGAITADFVDGYIVSIEPGRRFAFNSDLANAREYNTLDRFTSEYKPDLLVTQVVSNNELILLSESSGEVFYNSGASQQPFRTKRVFFDKGCSGRCNAAVIDNSFVFHSNDGMFYLYEGGVPKRISTRPIEQAVAGLNWSQAFAEVWVDGGHSVVYWTFPGGHTWGWDASSGKWHRRASYGMDRWRVNTMTRWTKSAPGKRDEWIAGDFQAGRLWRVDWDYLLEGDQEFVSEIVGVVLSDNQNPLTMPRLEVMLDTGQELTVAREFAVQPDPPTITGAAPDGSIGITYAGYAYTVTGTAPLTVTLRPGGILPPGITLSAAGVLSATVPTSIGTYPFTLRVTDGNGLYAELTDTVLIASIVALLGDSMVSLRPFLLFGAGGEDWNNAYQYNGLSPLLKTMGVLGGGGYWLTWPIGASNPVYSTTAAATAWTTSAAAFAAASKSPFGCYEPGADAFLIPANDGVYRTVDHGVTLTKVTTIPAYSVDASPTLAMGASLYELSVATAPAPFTTWTLLPTAHGITFTTGGIVRYGNERFLVGGDDGAGAGHFPKLTFTASGGAFSTETLPTLLANSHISAAAYSAVLDTWVVRTSLGQFLYKAGAGAWTLSSYAFGSNVIVKGIEWTGVNFVAAGNHNVTLGLGVLVHSSNGQTWTTAPTLEAINAQSLAVMK